MLVFFLSQLIGHQRLKTIREVDGEAAVQSIRRFCSAAGIPGPLKLNSLIEFEGAAWGYGPGKFRRAVLTSRNGKQVFMDMRKNGQFLEFRYASMQQTSRMLDKPISPSDCQQKAKNLMALFGYSEPVKFRVLPNDDRDLFQHAFFDVTVSGLPFFNLNPTYGYSLIFESKTGIPVMITRPLRIPQTLSSRPTISGSSAIAKLERWCSLNFKHGIGVVAMYDPNANWHPTATPELGYYKFKNEPKARLAWRANVWTHFMKTPSTLAGTIRMYVDAHTDEMIAPDDPGIN